MAAPKLSEQRARLVARELLDFRGWNLRPVSGGGQLLEESEFRSYPSLLSIFERRSKTGPGEGRPDFLLVESPSSLRPLGIIETKPSIADADGAAREAIHYGNALHDAGQDVLAVSVAGAEKEVCDVRVQRRVGGSWRPLTLHSEPIDWIPSPDLTLAILSTPNRVRVEPERPSDQALADQANILNALLRECNIKDEIRPVYAATFMLALWYGEVSTDHRVLLTQVNANAAAALKRAGKGELSSSLRVDSENEELAERAWQIVDILKKLNIRSFMQEHDYLGQLYETFFRYTGGNTIGQYFTPRHIVKFMCDLAGVTASDKVFDPACGTGGFLIGALNRMIRAQNLTYQEAMKKVKRNIFGIESEPTTAALCVTNMILRGDGTSGILKANCFKVTDYPDKPVDHAFLNPPFPHKKKKRQQPPTAFIDRALTSVRDGGHLTCIIPYSLLTNVKSWHKNFLKHNRLLFVATMPDDLFCPYSHFDTAVLLIEKGVPHKNSRVFFCRIDNDGTKLKKNVRIPREGSQLEPALDAFDRKSEVPEFSAYRQLTEKSAEWSPELFLESALHNDAAFIAGFEQHVRNQAAFYVKNGHRLIEGTTSAGPAAAEQVFAPDTELSLTGKGFVPFRVGDYFTVTLGGKEEIEDLEDGDDPFVSMRGVENGVSAWKIATYLFPPPAVTVATDGITCSSYVQEFPFYAFYKMAILRPKKVWEVPEDALYFIAYAINREVWRYVRARKFGKKRIENTELFAPAREGRPDFQWMAETVRKLRAFPLIASFREAYRAQARAEFPKLVAEWKSNRRPVASVIDMAEHAAYRRIVHMGLVAVPLLLEELRRQPDHWFVALHELTGADPVPEADRGRIKAMAAAWIRWGEEHDYVR